MRKSSLLILLFSFTALIIAQQKPVTKPQTTKPVEQTMESSSGKFIGSMFNDLFYVIQEPKAGNLSKTTSGRNADILRRANIGYEYFYSKDVTAMIVYDASANVLQQGFAEIRNLGPMMDLKVGLSQTLSSETVDKIWEYRSLDATVLDKNGMTNEFDMGLTLTGRMNSQGTTYAKLAVYNGSGTAPENDKLKKLALGIGNWFDKSSVLDLYVDYENVGAGRSTITAKAFFGMIASKYTFGVEGFYRMNRKFAGTKDVVPAGGSLFGWMEMMKATRFVLRVDMVDPDLNVSSTGYRELYLNAGVDYAPVANVHLIPNFGYVKELKKGSGTDIADNMTFRLTTSVNIK